METRLGNKASFRNAKGNKSKGPLDKRLQTQAIEANRVERRIFNKAAKKYCKAQKMKIGDAITFLISMGDLDADDINNKLKKYEAYPQAHVSVPGIHSSSLDLEPGADLVRAEFVEKQLALMPTTTAEEIRLHNRKRNLWEKQVNNPLAPETSLDE
jgi:hypothetical protein